MSTKKSGEATSVQRPDCVTARTYVRYTPPWASSNPVIVAFAEVSFTHPEHVWSAQREHENDNPPRDFSPAGHRSHRNGVTASTDVLGVRTKSLGQNDAKYNRPNASCSVVDVSAPHVVSLKFPSVSHVGLSRFVNDTPVSEMAIRGAAPVVESPSEGFSSFSSSLRIRMLSFNQTSSSR